MTAASLAVYISILKKEGAATDSECVDSSEAEAEIDLDPESSRTTWDKLDSKEADTIEADTESDLQREANWIIWDKCDSEEQQTELWSWISIRIYCNNVYYAVNIGPYNG